MPPFPKPRFDYRYDLARELAAVRAYRRQKPGRQIPQKGSDRLLAATWNIANLGVQDRLDSDYALIAEMIGWFDLVAVQEVNDNLSGIEAIHSKLPARYDLLFSDASGNQERQAFLYDTRKVSRLKEIGRVSIPPSDLGKIRLPGTTTAFPGFDRGPYLATFASGSFRFSLLNVHLYYGSPDPPDVDRRTLETFAVAWWAERKHRDARSYVPEVLPLGDFNLPKQETGDAIYDALVSRGLHVPPHTLQIGSAIASDSYYDQIAFFPGPTNDRFTGAMNVFDFDGRSLPGSLAAAARKPLPELRPLPHLGPPPAVGGVPDCVVHEAISIRPARANEGERLRAIALAAKAHWGYDEDWVRGWAAQGDFSPEALAAKPVLVAELGGHALGFASLIPRGEVCVLDDLWIDPDWLRRGIGTRLFEACAERARDLGAMRMEWEAEPNAVGFYERMGGRYLRDSPPTELGRVIPVMGVELSPPRPA